MHHEGRIDAICTYHSEHIALWSAERAARGGNADFRAFTPSPAEIPTEIVPADWDGSSGLFAVRCALFHMGASGAILCGVPLEREAGHFHFPGQWAPVTTYRQEWQAVAPLIGERVRSMGGWTAQTFGHPTPEWVQAVRTLKPMGITAPQNRTRPMHTVKNISDTTQRFYAMREQGGFEMIRLAPGESGQFEIDPLQHRFNGGALKAEAVTEAAAETKPKSKAKPVEPVEPTPLSVDIDPFA